MCTGRTEVQCRQPNASRKLIAVSPEKSQTHSQKKAGKLPSHIRAYSHSALLDSQMLCHNTTVIRGTMCQLLPLCSCLVPFSVERLAIAAAMLSDLFIRLVCSPPCGYFSARHEQTIGTVPCARPAIQLSVKFPKDLQPVGCSAFVVALHADFHQKSFLFCIIAASTILVAHWA